MTYHSKIIYLDIKTDNMEDVFVNESTNYGIQHLEQRGVPVFIILYCNNMRVIVVQHFSNRLSFFSIEGCAHGFWHLFLKYPILFQRFHRRICYLKLCNDFSSGTPTTIFLYMFQSSRKSCCILNTFCSGTDVWSVYFWEVSISIFYSFILRIVGSNFGVSLEDNWNTLDWKCIGIICFTVDSSRVTS